MSQLIGSNIAADGQAEFTFLQKFLKWLEEKDLLKDRTEEARMRREIANHLGDGKDAIYKLIDKKQLPLFEQELKKAQIPYTKIYDSQMNPAIVVRDIDQDKFLEIQKNIFSLDARMNAQIGVEELCKVTESMQMKQMVCISFDNEIDLAEAQNKAYSMGFVTGVMDNKLYIQPTDVFNDRGEDLAAFEASWAINQSMNDSLFGGTDLEDSNFQKLRSAQAEYDLNQIKGFSKALQGKADPVLMIDATGKGRNALEVSDKGLVVHRMDTSGKMKSELLLTKDDLSVMNSEQIGAVIAKQGFDIRNKVLIPSEHKNKVLNTKASEIRSFVKQYCGDNARPKPMDYDVDENTLKIKKTLLEPAIEEVMQEARRMAKADKRYKNKLTKCIDNELIVKEYAAMILKDKKMAGLQKFIQSKDETLTEQQKIEWLDNIAKHLSNTNEKCRHECQVEIVDVKQVRKDIEAMKEKKNAILREMDRAKEEKNKGQEMDGFERDDD